MTLFCDTAPGDDVNITWTFNSEPVSESSLGFRVTSGSLHIPSFVHLPKSSSHEGMYRCVANNSLGAVVSRPAKLVRASKFSVKCSFAICD